MRRIHHAQIDARAAPIGPTLPRRINTRDGIRERDEGRGEQVCSEGGVDFEIEAGLVAGDEVGGWRWIGELGEVYGFPAVEGAGHGHVVAKVPEGFFVYWGHAARAEDLVWRVADCCFVDLVDWVGGAGGVEGYAGGLRGEG